MWRRCDLHRHSYRDGEASASAEPQVFVESCLAEGVEVASVTDHNFVGNVEAILEAAAGTSLHIIPGLELGTDRGDVLILAPNPTGLATLKEFCLRLGVHESQQVQFDRLTSDFQGANTSGARYADELVLIGAHVDQSGALLGSTQTASLENQLRCAEHLQALEVARPEVLIQWASESGVKQSGRKFTLLRGSDAHPGTTYLPRSTWLYLPQVSAGDLRHALATPESSVRLTDSQPELTKYWIQSVSIHQGPYDGLNLEFEPRANALIGPPSSGKSFVLDAIRWVLSSPCPISDVAAATNARLGHCLPAGGSVTIRLIVDGNPHDITRVQGGSSVSESQFRPIVFSQTELTRRAMEPVPSIDLLDIHEPDIERAEAHLASLAGTSEQVLNELSELASKAGTLRLVIGNPQDGLDATRAELAALLGTEPVTKTAADLGRVEAWRRGVATAIAPLRQLQVPLPALPPVPNLEVLPGAASLTPGPAADALLASLQETIAKAAEATHFQITELLAGAEASLEEENTKIADELARLGLPSADTVTQRLHTLRARVAELEASEHELATWDMAVDQLVERLCALIEDGEATRKAIVASRKATCSRLNESMRTFRSRIIEDARTAELDAALDDLKTGTNLFPDAMRRVRIALDRKRMVLFTAAYLAHRPWTPPQPISEDMVNQDSVVRVAVDREKYRLLAITMLRWPDDALDLFRPDGASQIRFHDLTEGLRALAIKEISFAASHLPVVSDQPEDAVPTTAVFESLVPTIREQRIDRQFIVASHDANIVVAGDIERVFVMSASPGENPRAGTLFETELRGAAMDLLEGGQAAFRLRQTRYGA